MFVLSAMLNTGRLHQTCFPQVRLQVDERLMADNRLESTLLIWPNEMNVHGTLFGGIVTRTAIEMAYMTVAQVRTKDVASQPLSAARAIRSSGREELWEGAEK
jgi:acyl-coenzyme A thioesterase PaaI-like protein